MSRLILLFALVLAAPPVLGASYERQSDAIKQCQQADLDDRPTVFFKCMQDAGWNYGACPEPGSKSSIVE
jgi:hypothetical protein